MTFSMHADDVALLKSAANKMTPAINELLRTKKSRNVSSVIEELRVIGRTGEKAPAELARILVPQLRTAVSLDLEIGR